MLARADLIVAVAGELGEILTLAGISAGDDAANLKGPLDRTYRALGFSEAALASAVADGEEARAVAYATYFVLARAAYALAKKMTVSAGAAKAALEQQYLHVRELMSEALAIAQSYGLTLPGNGTTGVYGIPYAGGIEAGDYEVVDEDAGRLQPLFSLDMHRSLTLEEWLSE